MCTHWLPKRQLHDRQKLLASRGNVPLSWLTFVNVKTTAAARRSALEAAPLERITEAEVPTLMVAGGRQTKGALPVATDHFEAALYTSRGRGYARYNEDGAGLYTDERGTVYASVFDQAGGLGGSIRGAASELAATYAFRGFRDLATGQGDGDVAMRLRQVVEDAHQALVNRAEGEVTTAVLAVARPGSITMVNSGDSAAMRFDERGQLQAMTDKHEVTSPAGIGCLVHALGLTPEGPAPDTYQWPLPSGHWLLMGSDGLLDAGMDDEMVGRILMGATGPEDAVNQLARLVLRRMTLMQAKPDNLTMIAIRAR